MALLLSVACAQVEICAVQPDTAGGVCIVDTDLVIEFATAEEGAAVPDDAAGAVTASGKVALLAPSVTQLTLSAPAIAGYASFGLISANVAELLS